MKALYRVPPERLVSQSTFHGEREMEWERVARSYEEWLKEMTSSPLGAKDLQECSLLSSEMSKRGGHACM